MEPERRLEVLGGFMLDFFGPTEDRLGCLETCLADDEDGAMSEFFGLFEWPRDTARFPLLPPIPALYNNSVMEHFVLAV